jgi:hypothetical protein
MKNLYLLLTTFLLGIIALQAQHLGSKKINGNGFIKTFTREGADYESIYVHGSLDVELIHGIEGKIEIQAEENLIEYIKTKVVGNELTIRVKKGYSLRPSIRKRIVITVPFEHINEVSLSGSGDIESTSAIKTKHFSVAISGSGDIDLNVVSRSISADIAGSGDLKIYGKTDHIEISIAGSGDVSTYELKAKTAGVSVAGSGDVKLFISESLDASITGSGDIHYKGNPLNVEKRIVGSGDISKY